MNSASMRGVRRRLRTESLEPRQLLAGDLRIVEVNYHPHAAFVQFGERDVGADNFEFVELQNIGDAILNLNGYEITQGITFRFDQQFLAAGERVVITKDLRDFRSRFGNDVPIAFGSDGEGGDIGEFKGSLNNGGEQLTLADPTGRTLQTFHYFDTGEWPGLADGQGASLELVNLDKSPNDPKAWRPSALYGGSPGQAAELIPGEVVINEMLTHTDLPQIDTIELFNRTGQTVNMNGWYLSDSVANIFRFRISGDSAMLSPHDYLVYDESQLGFSFRGQEADDAFLIEADALGRPLRFVDAVAYGATQNGVSLGRWANGEGQLFPMTDLTFEDPNAGPLAGDVIISELNYHPALPPFGSVLTQDDLEFVELYNRTGAPLDISQWRLREAVDFVIPTTTVIGPSETLIVVGFDPVSRPITANAFRETYGLPSTVELLGPYSDAKDPNADQLDDDGERLIWERPEDILQLGLGYVLVDRVTYQDSGDWPEEADGAGSSLRRIESSSYGDFGASWVAASPSPGTTGVPGDLNDDGLVNATDLDSLCTAISLGGVNPRFDLNRDAIVDMHDLTFAVTELLQTTLGDANLDGRFDSADLVQVFAAGEYEDSVRLNSSWATGDWNCDREFNTSDMVSAFVAGGYVSSASPNTLHAAAASQSAIAAASAVDDRDINSTNRRTRSLGSYAVDVPAATHAARPKVLAPQAVDSLFAALV